MAQVLIIAEEYPSLNRATYSLTEDLKNQPHISKRVPFYLVSFGKLNYPQKNPSQQLLSGLEIKKMWVKITAIERKEFDRCEYRFRGIVYFFETNNNKKIHISKLRGKLSNAVGTIGLVIGMIGPRNIIELRDMPSDP